MHDYRAIFLDIDGTLTQPGHSAPPVSAVAAIESARQPRRLRLPHDPAGAGACADGAFG